MLLSRVYETSAVFPDGFDGRGNYNMGLRDQLIFRKSSMIR
jgi:ribosomal protein L5